FEGSNALTLIALKLDRDPPTLAQTTGDTWPAAIERYLSKIMARERERRFGTAMEALEGWRKVCKVMGNARRRAPAPPPPPAFSMRDDHTEVTAASLNDVSLGSPSTRRR
ncbi:MAG: hypothetical protein KF894_30690, partial [Labilithrix sp.]|nr:hypothetical protein [Labilithrix sp.]